ncbi:uncharacterized protein LOC116205788 [Punica granatum]|uniref:Uncharacterized protein LOC116205788 n=2 Tax=Punica granatum TaxID=22663 RepID=A0A6P8DQQ2_PUNGR|nr:uncharacterized protein LOC116205788 [Punica granatum]PKI78721.1 hypothetical protein CRG98_000946 [Punica granatum]
MEWLQPRRRGPEWKQGWTEKTQTSFSAPPLHLLTVFLIVIFLLWCSSSSSDPRPYFGHSLAGLQLLLLLSPVLAVFIMALYSRASRYIGSGSRSNLNAWFGAVTPGQARKRPRGRSSAGMGIPWKVAFMVGLLLVLVAYHSSF